MSTASTRTAIEEGTILRVGDDGCIAVADRTGTAEAIVGDLADYESIFGSTDDSLKKGTGPWYVPIFQIGPTMRATETKHVQLEAFTVCTPASRDVAAAKKAAAEAAAAVEAAANGRGRRSRAKRTVELIDVIGVRNDCGVKESYPHAPVPILNLIDRVRAANAGLIDAIRSSGIDGAADIADGLFRAVAFQVHYGPAWSKDKDPDLGTHRDNEAGLLAAVLTISEGRTVTVGRPPTKELAGLTAGHFYAMTAASLDHGHQWPELLSCDDSSLSVVMRVHLPAEKKATVKSWDLNQTSRALAGLLEEHGICI